MGTNFYWIEKQKWMEKFEKNSKIDFDDDMNIFKHIGKRSAAGFYCKSCGATLCEYGTRHVHDTYITMPYGEKEIRFHDVCPVCNSDKNLIGACSFTWTFMKHKRELEKLAKKNSDEKVVQDEYGEQFTAKEFLEEVDVSIEFQDASEFC